MDERQGGRLSAREAALARAGRVKRWVAGGAVALTGIFSAVAAHADTQESTLWSSVVVLEEGAELLRKAAAASGTPQARKLNAKARIRDANAKAIRKMLENMSEGIVLIDKDFNWTFGNDQFNQFLDVPREITQPGTSCYDVLRYQAKRGDFGDRKDVLYGGAGAESSRVHPGQEADQQDREKLLGG